MVAMNPSFFSLPMFGFSATGFGATSAGGATAAFGPATGMAETAAGAGVPLIMAFITVSLAPAFFRRTISSVLKSKVWPLFWILAMIRSSEIPAPTNEITPSTVNPVGDDDAVPAEEIPAVPAAAAPAAAPDGVPA